jgi:hypothetical protein
MEKKIYKTIVTVEILHEQPIQDHVDLVEIANEINDGSWSGVVTFGEAEPLFGQAAADATFAQGSTPDFFGMDENGIVSIEWGDEDE